MASFLLLFFLIGSYEVAGPCTVCFSPYQLAVSNIRQIRINTTHALLTFVHTHTHTLPPTDRLLTDWEEGIMPPAAAQQPLDCGRSQRFMADRLSVGLFMHSFAVLLLFFFPFLAMSFSDRADIS